MSGARYRIPVVAAALCVAGGHGARVVSFITGGKCGSTTLASLLKHRPPRYGEYDPASGFADAGKELCGQSIAVARTGVVLDGCPRRMTQARAATTLAVDPHAVGVLLVRPQASALLSLYRDTLSSGRGGGGANEWVLAHRFHQEYNFTAAYLDARRWGFQSIVVVRTRNLHTAAGVGAAVATIRRHAGLPPAVWAPGPIVTNRATNDDARYRAGALAPATRATVSHAWRATNIEFAVLTGVVV